MLSPNQEVSALRMKNFLVERLGETFVKAIVGIKAEESFATHNYSEGEVETLEAAVQVWSLVSKADGDDVARAWFIGGNPDFDGSTAITLLREGNSKRVIASATNYFEHNQ